MSEYAPTTDDVEIGYCERETSVSGMGHFAAGAAFDRWLAEERRAAAEKAWDEAMRFIYANAWVSLDPGKAPVENPYRAKETKA